MNKVRLMKKKFVVFKADEIKKHEAELKRCQVIGFRMVDPKDGKNQFVVSNLNVPGKIEWDDRAEELVIRIRVKMDEFVALGDSPGTPSKHFIKDISHARVEL